MLDLLPIVRDFGLPVALVLFFLYDSKRREDRFTVASESRELRMGNRIDTLENEFREQLMGALDLSTRVVERNTHVIERLERRLPD
jgi:hypothetical protein